MSVTVPVVQLEIKPEPLVADDASEDELSTVPNQLENVNVIEAVQKVVENIAEELSTVDKAPNDVLPSQPLVSKDIIPAHSTQNLTQGYSVIVDSLEKSLLNLEISASETLGLELNKSVKEKLKKESTSTDTNSLENSIASLSLKTELAPIEPISSVKSQPEDCRPNDKANNAEDTVEIGNYLKAIQSEVPSLYNSIPFKTHQSADCLTVILETTEKLEFTQSPLELILQFSSTKMTINFPSEISLISVDVNEFNTCILIEKSSEQFWKWIKIDGLEHRFPDYDVPVPIDDISLKLETRVKKDGIELQVTKSGDAKDLDLLFANDLVFELD